MAQDLASMDGAACGMMAPVIENAPVLIEELDRRKAAMAAAPGVAEAEMAVWEAAAQLGVWHVVNRGTREDPKPSGFEVAGIGQLLGVYSASDRAAAVAGESGSVLAVPVPQALDWLASFAEHGVAGIVLDRSGPWTPLPNLRFFRQWVPQSQTAVTRGPVIVAPQVQTATDTYSADRNDETYAAVVREIAAADVLVVLDPQRDDATPTSIVNGRGERVLMAFTDTERVNALYGGKAVQVQQRAGSEILGLVGERFDALVLDPQHTSSFAVTPEWIRKALDGGERKRRGWGRRGR